MITTKDSESQHKVKFNTLHFLPGIAGGSKRGRPSTLSEIIEEKISNSINISSPLVHLYKNKRKNIQDSMIRIETNEDPLNSTNRNSIIDKYVPKEIQRTLKQKQQREDSENLDKKQSRIKTEPSPDRDLPSNKKTSGAMTEFSKRLLNSTAFGAHDFRMGTSTTKFHVPTKD